VSGYYKDHGMPIQRGRFYIYASISENDLFQYMVSPKGFILIDPASTEESLSDPPITSFDWNEGRLEVDHAVMNLPKLLKKKGVHRLQCDS